MNTTQPQLDWLAWCMLLALAGLWGGSFFFVEVALRGLPPFTLVLLRVGFAAVFLHVLLRALKIEFPTTLAAFVSYLVMGLLNNAIPFTLITLGQVRIDSSTASILNASMPFFTVGFAHFLTRDEKLTRNRAIGIAIGFCGVVVLAGPSALRGHTAAFIGMLMVLMAAVSYAFAAIFGKRLAAVHPMASAAGMLTASTAYMAVLALSQETVIWNSVESTVWLAVIGLSIASTAIAYLLFFSILARAGSGNVSLVTFLIPPVAVLLGYLFLDERLTTPALFGMALIFAGLVIVDGRVMRKR